MKTIPFVITAAYLFLFYDVIQGIEDGLVVTCSVSVVVTLQPCLHTNQVMLIYKEDDVLGPVNLTW